MKNNSRDECRFVDVDVHISRQTGPSEREKDLSIDEVSFFQFCSPLCISLLVFYARLKMHSSRMSIVSIIIINLDRSSHKKFAHLSHILCRCMNSTRLIVVFL